MCNAYHFKVTTLSILFSCDFRNLAISNSSFILSSFLFLKIYNNCEFQIMIYPEYHRNWNPQFISVRKASGKRSDINVRVVRWSRFILVDILFLVIEPSNLLIF